MHMIFERGMDLVKHMNCTTHLSMLYIIIKKLLKQGDYIPWGGGYFLSLSLPYLFARLTLTIKVNLSLHLALILDHMMQECGQQLLVVANIWDRNNLQSSAMREHVPWVISKLFVLSLELLVFKFSFFFCCIKYLTIKIEKVCLLSN